MNVEAGLAWESGALSLDAALFRRDGTDVIDFVRSSPSEPYRATNLRSVDTTGVEATAALDLARLARTPLARVVLRAALYRASLDPLPPGTEGRYVLDPLRFRWDLVAEARLPFRVDALARLSYFDRPSFPEPVLLLDARIAYGVLEGEVLELFVDGENLGDVAYEEVPGVPLPGRTFAAGLRLAW